MRAADVIKRGNKRAPSMVVRGCQMRFAQGRVFFGKP